MSLQERIQAFLQGEPFAVVGASTNRDKYGNKVLRTYLQNDLRVFPVNPGATEIEGLDCYPDLFALPERPHGVSIITPPDVTESVVDAALDAGVPHLWMQPGAESPAAVERALSAGASVISGGPCLLVALGYRE